MRDLILPIVTTLALQVIPYVGSERTNGLMIEASSSEDRNVGNNE
jgi:hypothetical protein